MVQPVPSSPVEATRFGGRARHAGSYSRVRCKPGSGRRGGRGCAIWRRVESNLASCRRNEEKYAEAERIEREVLGVQMRILGEEHPETLRGADNLA